MNYVRRSVTEFVAEMAERKIPSPAAGSSLAVSLMMACSLMELTLSELAEKGEAGSGRNPAQDLEQIRRWRSEGEQLVDADIRAVEEMLQAKGAGDPERLLAPALRLVTAALETGNIIRAYVDVPSEKISDTVVALLFIRTVLTGACHIVFFNSRVFGWSVPLPEKWKERLEEWDLAVERLMARLWDG